MAFKTWRRASECAPTPEARGPSSAVKKGLIMPPFGEFCSIDSWLGHLPEFSACARFDATREIELGSSSSGLPGGTARSRRFQGGGARLRRPQRLELEERDRWRRVRAGGFLFLRGSSATPSSRGEGPREKVRRSSSAIDESSTHRPAVAALRSSLQKEIENNSGRSRSSRHRAILE